MKSGTGRLAKPRTRKPPIWRVTRREIFGAFPKQWDHARRNKSRREAPYAELQGKCVSPPSCAAARRSAPRREHPPPSAVPRAASHWGANVPPIKCVHRPSLRLPPHPSSTLSFDRPLRPQGTAPFSSENASF